MPIAEEKDVEQWCAQYNAGTAGIVMPLDIRHSYANWEWIAQEVKNGKAADLAALAGKCKGPAMLLASGPSLDDVMPHLKNWKGAICCSSSQASTLVYYGRQPDFIVQLDAQTRMDEFIVPQWGPNTALICNPGCHPEIIRSWKNPKFYYRQIDPQREFYSQVLPTAYPFITTQLLLFSCSPAAQLGILRNLGFNPIFFVGMDMGYVGHKNRFTWWRYTEVGPQMRHGKYRPGSWRWIPDPPAMRPDNVIRANNGVITDKANLFFKRSIFAVGLLETHRPEAPQLIYASKGIFTEFPTVDVMEVIERQGQGYEELYRTNEQTRWVCERYLATQKMYTIEFGGGEVEKGVRFLETSDWKNVVPDYIKAQQAQGLPIESVETAMERIGRIVADIEQEAKEAEGGNTGT